jgi:hypothetical protein
VKQHGTTRLDNLIATAGYGSSECSYERRDGAMPVLRIPNMVPERIELGDLKSARLSKRDREKLLLSAEMS